MNNERDVTGGMQAGGLDHGLEILREPDALVERLRRFGLALPGQPLYDAAADEIDRLRAEIEELKQWMEEACEIFHDLLPWSTDSHYAILDLLRKAENP